MSTNLYSKYFIVLTLLLVCLFVLNISLGSVNIPLKAILNTFIGSNTVKESWQTILINFRLPKAITAIYVGSGLSVCGLLMQTLFKNPLAGPYVLGISSGASLGVALLLLGSTTFGFAVTTNQHWLLPIAASLGAFYSFNSHNYYGL
jgi:ABC-type Fe3+-siderophore transport system, permease component